MKPYILRWIFIFLGLAMTGCGSGEQGISTDSIAASFGMPSTDNGGDSNAEERENMLVVRENRTLEVFSTPSGSTKTLTLKKGDTINIMDAKPGSNGFIARILVESENGPQMTSGVYWVNLDDLNDETDFYMAADEDPFDENGEERVAMDTVEDSLLWLAKKAKKKMTYCFRYVKTKLIKLGLVKDYLPGVSAKSAASTLPKYGFRASGRGRDNARVNDVCVYNGGNGGHGHIEIRLKGGWWYGYGLKNHPISLKNHKLLGCFAK